jgi:hypothetical protein
MPYMMMHFSLPSQPQNLHKHWHVLFLVDTNVAQLPGQGLADRPYCVYSDRMEKPSRICSSTEEIFTGHVFLISSMDTRQLDY